MTDAAHDRPEVPGFDGGTDLVGVPDRSRWFHRLRSPHQTRSFDRSHPITVRPGGFAYPANPHAILGKAAGRWGRPGCPGDRRGSPPVPAADGGHDDRPHHPTLGHRQELSAAELDRAGLLYADTNVVISRFAIFLPADELGEPRPVVVRAGAVIGPFAVVHGGTTLNGQARIEEHVVIGKPELGYAVGSIRPGAGGGTVIGAGAVVRSRAVVYADVEIGENTLIGHHTLLRTAVRVGADAQLGHHLTVERATRIGRDVRCSPGSHITSSTVLADRVFLGAGVRTINDKTLSWRDPHREPTLVAPRFDIGAKVGTGCVVLAGVTIGEHALVGAGSLVTHDIPPGALAYGHPARVHGEVR
ncbi:hypothetical protein [Saccharothrix hoggarensis]|uniref:Transferase family hexapeptide repeat protein n=1 Tax=Saccharothrix hoggarensis TaxID=913853 RepID=A0ABW3QMF5_9PSEU